MPEVTAADAEDLDAAERVGGAACRRAAETHRRSRRERQRRKLYAALDRGDEDGEGVRIAITKVQHGLGTTRYLPREFFGTNEYRHIMALAAKLNDLLSEGAFVKRGERELPIESFAEAVEWLMSEARRGQSIQRYKGLGEMNPDQLWDTTVNPETRRLMQVKIEDAVKADEIFTTLMGDQVEPRREFIEKNALTVENLDV